MTLHHNPITMRTYFILLFFIATCTPVCAQSFSNAGHQALIDAEFAFAAMAKVKNTHDAFSVYLTYDAITFGEQVRIGKKYLENQPPDKGLLSWYPVYSDIAASGDFGFNTGPWEYRVSRTDSMPAAQGQFISVWRKVNGVWRVALDIGVSHDKGSPAASLRHSHIMTTAQKGAHTETEIMRVENRFRDALDKTGTRAYHDVLSAEARLYRDGEFPVTTTDEIRYQIKMNPGKKIFTPIGAQVSTTGDMGFVYGSAEWSGHAHHYLRIWKKENGKTWRLVLEVIA